MMNRKEASASQLRRLQSKQVSVLWWFWLQENGDVKRFSLSVWEQPLSPYKMAPCVFCFFNGIIFLFGSGVKPWRSPLAAHFTLCIDSDVQKQHRMVTVKQPWASLTPGRKHSAPARRLLKTFDQTDPPGSHLVVNNNFWLLLRLNMKISRGWKLYNMLCCVCVALQRWSRAGWEWRRVKRNVHVSSTQRETNDEGRL